MGDTYIIIEGGIVQNNPTLPVFDLDFLENDTWNEETAEEAIEIFERMAQHPDRAGLASAMVRIAQVLDDEGLDRAREILGGQDPLKIDESRPTTTKTTISVQVHDTTEVNIDLTVTDELLAQAEAAGYPRSPKGVTDMIAQHAGGEQEIDDAVNQATPNALLEREVRWVSALGQE